MDHPTIIVSCVNLAAISTRQHDHTEMEVWPRHSLTVSERIDTSQERIAALHFDLARAIAATE